MQTVATDVLVLAASALVLIVAGTRFTLVVDRLADRLGIGEALAGAVLLGATTSLPGLLVTVLTAAGGAADLAASNALGGIAAQTVFLAIADLSYRHANLEHAAASLPNLLQTMVLVALVSLVLLATSGPPFAWGGIHPVTAVLPVVYVGGLVLTKRSREQPMWKPRLTSQTRPDVPDAAARSASLTRLLGSFAALGAVVAACGFAVAHAGVALAEQTALSGTIVGGFITSVVTSLPELVTALAAVRAGAITLAVADIIGGNTFDVLFLAAGDVAFREGSIYAAVGEHTVFLLALTLLLTSIFAAGLIYRQRTGIGFEGAAILVVYAIGLLALLGMR
jgi:cation:H+ antiporter